MTTTTFFDALQTATLNGIYEDREEWWLYWYLLSDAVQEVDEVAADGMRWLYEIKQRPSEWYGSPGSGVHWYATVKPIYDYFNNYIPLAFKEIAYGTTECMRAAGHEFETPIEALDAFLDRWVELSAETRQRLWREWAKR